jgi:DNA primase
MNALIPESILAEIRARLPINEVVGRLARLRRNGRSWRGPCPLHGSTSASLQASPDRQSFHCFGCGAHGDVFGWVMRTEGCDFRQAVLRCAGEAGVELDGDAGERRATIRSGCASPPSCGRRRRRSRKARRSRPTSRRAGCGRFRRRRMTCCARRGGAIRRMARARTAPGRPGRARSR